MLKLVLFVVSLVLLKTNGEEGASTEAPTAEASTEAPAEVSSVADASSEAAPEVETTVAPPAAGEPPPVPAEGCTATVDDTLPGDVVHPNLNSWKSALLAKKDRIKTDMTPEENDDAATIALKSRFKAQMTQVENMMTDEKLMANANQMDIAYTMAKVESVLNTIGRNLYGINWRTKGCGAGFILTTECGNQVKK